MARRNVVRSWITASLSVMVVVIAGLLPVRVGPAGAADQRGFQITVSDAGFNPPVVLDVNVGDVLMFNLDQTTERHTVTFQDDSLCPGSRGAVPCWPELRFDDGHPNCQMGNVVLPGRRCMIVRDPGKTVQYHDAFIPANSGEVRVLGEATTTTGPATSTTTAPTTTSTTLASTTTTTLAHTTTTTSPTAIHPFVIQDPPPTTSTSPTAFPAAAGPSTPTPSTANKEKEKGKDKAKSKVVGTETPTTAPPAPPGSMPPDSVFDPAALTPGPVVVPDTPGDPSFGDGANLESSAVLNLLDSDKPADDDNTRLLLIAAGGAFALLVVVAGMWCWLHRASRYDPA